MLSALTRDIAMIYYMIVVYIPESHLEQVKQAMFDAGAGCTGSYSCCAWQVKGEGQFKPEVGSHAYCGVVGVLEKVVEYQISTVCDSVNIKQVIAAMKHAHPYEMPAYGVIKLEDF